MKEKVTGTIRNRAVRIYGREDLRLEEFDMPRMQEDEILVRPVTDSICTSTYKLAMLGQENARAHEDMAHHPCIIGHEFCGEIVEAGAKWRDSYKAGDRFIIQPALNYKGTPDAPGFTFPYCGGNADYAIMPHQVMEMGCLIPCDLPAYYLGSLCEPLSTICCAFHAFFHTTPGDYEYLPGIAKNSRMAILAGAGPMGLGAIHYALSNEQRRPELLVVTDINADRLRRAQEMFPHGEALKKGVDLRFVDTSGDDPVKMLRDISEGQGFDDVLVMAPVAQVISQADQILAENGCMNFFSGPRDTHLTAPINFFNIHYKSTHIIGTKGGTGKDLKEVADLMARGLLDPSCMITHIGGMNAVADTVLNLPEIPGGKKLIYNQMELPLTALEDLETQDDIRLRELGEIVKRNSGIWNVECEDYIRSHFCV